MDASELGYANLTGMILKPYEKRATTVSAQFLRWFLENIFRLDRQDADDASVDAQQDKGIDGLYVNDATETIHLIQMKTKAKEKASQGDTEIKEFVGSLQQFKTPEGLQALLDGKANEDLKNAIKRNRLIDKIVGGYTVEGVFCSNAEANKDAKDYLGICNENVVLYDAIKIAREYVDIDSAEGIAGEFTFDLSGTDVIKYNVSDGVKARLFLANALQLTHLAGIEDGSLFEKNVRLSLGEKTNINKGLTLSIRDKSEHKNFPLYHNGITIVCQEFKKETDEALSVRNYVVVNGAQSLSSLYNTKNKITDDLRVMVRVIEVKDDQELAEKITRNSNNQNPIKPRDLRSNHGIQQRLKTEVANIPDASVVYEVKRGEKHKEKIPLSNEDAGLILLAMDLGEPWACHQKYKVMDESHSKIFGRPDVDGWKIVGLYELFSAVKEAAGQIDDLTFGNYTLTKYFLAHAVSQIVKDTPVGRQAFGAFKGIIKAKQLEDLRAVISEIAKATAQDLNAEIIAEREKEPEFDYKAELKSPTWCRTMTARLIADYKKDVLRKHVKPVDELLQPLFQEG